MMFKMYAIKDELSEFASPLAIQDDAQAKRYFRYEVSKTKLMSDNPEDFSIWEVGDFDSETGVVMGKTPKLVERAKSTRKEE